MHCWNIHTSILALILLFSLQVNAFYHNFFHFSWLNSLTKFIPLTGCTISNVALPACTLPDPESGLQLQFITLGRGTQNYTCASANESSIPAAVGATATLFDASCIAAYDQSILGTLPDLLKRMPLSAGILLAQLIQRFLGQEIIVGEHYFTADGYPFFDLRLTGSRHDWMRAGNKLSMDAPVVPGFGITGNVAWLKLSALEGGLREVYRVETGGGSPPATCLGMPESFTVDYVAQYSFYA